VAWVAERKDLLCALFYLLSIMSYTKYACSRESGVRSQESENNAGDEAGRKNFFTDKHYLLAFGFFVLALLSKPMAVSLPIVLLILDWYPLKGYSLSRRFAAFAEKLLSIALSLGSSIVTVIAQKQGRINTIRVCTIISSSACSDQILITYLGKMILPLDLLLFIHTQTKGRIAFIDGISFSDSLCWRDYNCLHRDGEKQRVWLSAWCYYVITLVPVLGIFQVGSQAMADRYTYLPSLGPFLIVGLAVAWGANKVNSLIKGKVIVRFFSAMVAILVFLSLTYLTFKQIGIWKNSIDLWTYVIEKEPEHAMAYNNRGEAFEKWAGWMTQ
jgi:hypothetical protein